MHYADTLQTHYMNMTCACAHAHAHANVNVDMLCTFYASLAQDRDARHAYRSAGGTDAAQADLALWHQLEERNPELFGRMHHVYARYVP